MSMTEHLMAEFENEQQTTRRFLERLPEDKLDWRPHEKSMTAGQLALHIAMITGAIVQMAREPEFDAPDFSKPFPSPASKQEVLDTFEQSVATVRELLPTFSDASMGETWRMVSGGTTLLEMPRAAVLRAVWLNHTYHHRGQFGVYLRQMGAPVPSAYGPSGDELPAGMAAEAG